MPIYEVLEKRYCVAGKIVETFMDPLYNSLVNNAFIPDSTTKQEIANTLYEGLSDRTLNRFAAVYRDPTLSEFESSLNEIITCVNSSINAELAAVLRGSLEHIKEIAELEMSASFLGNMQNSLNFPVFVGILMMIEVYGRLGIVNPTKIVHDEIHSFQEHLNKVFVKLRNAREGVFTFPNGAVLVFPLKHIDSIEFASSKDSVLVQAADILAGSINYLSRCAIQQKRIGDLDIELAEHLFPALLIDLPQIAWSVGSTRWHGQLGSYYFKRFQDPKEKVSGKK